MILNSKNCFPVVQEMQNLCQICKNEIFGKNYCKSCFLCFIKKQDSIIPNEVKGGGTFMDERSKLMGESAEEKFFNLCKSKGYSIRNATKFENMKKHYDFIVNINNEFLKVEVKAIKSRQRGEKPDPSVIYLELFNIDGGPGWIYGNADYIAFQTSGGFAMYLRTDLIKLVDYWKDRVPFVSKSGIDFTLYGRNNRKDLVLVLPFAEVNTISNKILM